MKKRRVVITLDRERLERLAHVKFSDNAFHELIELTSVMAGRFQDPKMPVFMLDGAWKERWDQDPKKIQMEVRRAFVAAVDGIWHEAGGGPGRGSFYVDGKKYTGPLNHLLRELLRAAGDDTPGAAATLHHDIEFLYTGAERNRGRPQKSR